MKKISILFTILLISFGNAFAEVKLPKVFSDNMVLQREMKVPIWGWADPGEKVVATLGGHMAETVADYEGKWKLHIGPLDAGGPFEFIVEGKNKITIKNVLVGEVWICSGQSNMAMEVRSCLNAEEEINSADYPEIRLFQVKRVKASEPLDDVSPVDDPENSFLNKWQVSSPNSVGTFTGVGYFFGREIHKKLDVPVGLLSVSWGGTTVEAWTPLDTFQSDPKLGLALTNWADYNNDEEWLTEQYARYIKEVEKAKNEGATPPLYFNQPTVLYNGIISPIVPYGVRGVTWYQGESNAYRAYQYRELFPAMIKQWRNKWGQGDFPSCLFNWLTTISNHRFSPNSAKPRLLHCQCPIRLWLLLSMWGIHQTSTQKTNRK